MTQEGLRQEKESQGPPGSRWLPTARGQLVQLASKRVLSQGLMELEKKRRRERVWAVETVVNFHPTIWDSKN